MSGPRPSPPDAFDPAGLTDDALLGGRLRLLQPARGFRSGQDALLLAAAVPARPGEGAFEPGCGAGAAILALGLRVPNLRLAALELQPAYAELARENARRNGLALDLALGDVAAAPPDPAGPFDHALLNPPFFQPEASSRARDAGRDLARAGPAPLAAWLALCARRLRPGGTLTMINRADRLADALGALPAAMGSAAILPLAPRPGRDPALILLRARKGGRAPLRLHHPLALHDGAAFAPWADAVLRGAAPLPWPPAPSGRTGETTPPPPRM